MITVRFFASLRERLGEDETTVDPEAATTVSEVQQTLAQRSETWADSLSDHRVLAAVNQAMARPDSPVEDGDEVAFFPPVTGG